MVIGKNIIVMMVMLVRQVSLCIWRSAAVFPLDLLSPPSSAPQLTLNLILADDDDDDGDDGDDDDIETNIVVTIFLIPNIAVSVHTVVDSARQSSQAGAGEVLYTQVDVQPPPSTHQHHWTLLPTSNSMFSLTV